MALESTSDVAAALATGISALVVSTLGVPLSLVGWGLVGSTIGASLAPSSSRWRALAVFVAATLSCALFGAIVGPHWFVGEPRAASAAACVAGIIFHPVIAAVVGHIPALGAWFVGRITGGKT